MSILIILILFIAISIAIVTPLLEPPTLISREEPKTTYERERVRIEREVQLDIGIGKASKEDTIDLSSEFSKKKN